MKKRGSFVCVCCAVTTREKNKNRDACKAGTTNRAKKIFVARGRMPPRPPPLSADGTADGAGPDIDFC